MKQTKCDFEEDWFFYKVIWRYPPAAMDGSMEVPAKNPEHAAELCRQWHRVKHKRLPYLIQIVTVMGVWR